MTPLDIAAVEITNIDYLKSISPLSQSMNPKRNGIRRLSVNDQRTQRLTKYEWINYIYSHPIAHVAWRISPVHSVVKCRVREGEDAVMAG